MIKTKFVFAVSLVAMLAVSSAWANAPASGESVGTAHDVYEDQTPTDGAGIAGVSYVNKAVNKAGASAQAAEAHAAAAGQSALNAASSAAEAAASAQSANEALENKEATANKLTSTATIAVSDSNKDTLYPSVGKVQSMIDALDVTDSAQTGQYVSEVSESNGVISVKREALPTVNNATLTIQQNGEDVATFTANSGTPATANITVPTMVTDLSDYQDYATVQYVDDQIAAYDEGIGSTLDSLTNTKQAKLTATGSANRPVYAVAGGVEAVTGMSIPYGAESNPTSWATIWVE